MKTVYNESVIVLKKYASFWAGKLLSKLPWCSACLNESRQTHSGTDLTVNFIFWTSRMLN